MQMLYNSDSFAVLRVDIDAQRDEGGAVAAPARGGFEIVDKFARKGIFLDGELARRFDEGVRLLIQSGPSEEALDDYIAGYTQLAQQPIVLH